jgi:N-acetylglutamate synthase-like GNAT family acetyltransferase
MPTFAELLQSASTAESKLVILQYLVDHIDLNFRPCAGVEPKQKLLDNKNVPIAPEMFEAVVTGVLLKASEELAKEITAINTSNLAVQAKTKKGKESK